MSGNAAATQLQRKVQRKPRKFKDKNKPKRGKSAYMFFSIARREGIIALQPDLKVTEVAKVVSKEWHKLTPEDKKPYEEYAKADRERYLKEMETYVPPPAPKVKKQKDPNAPRKPKTAFMAFAAHYRPHVKKQFPDLGFGEIAKRVGAMWQKMSADDRAPFTEESDRDKERYRREKELYEAQGMASSLAAAQASAAAVESEEEESGSEESGSGSESESNSDSDEEDSD